MIWQDKGFLLSKNKYNENSAITEFYTENHGKTTGFIFGSTSKKIKNYLFVGNNFHLNFNSKLDSQFGSFKAEIEQIYTPIYLDNKKKLYAIIYAMNLIKILTADNQVNVKIYNLIIKFFNILKNQDWLFDFIFWELEFFKLIGYDIDFKNYVKNTIINGNNQFVVESSNKIIPNFLIDKKKINNDKNEILNGYNIVGDFLDKTILKPNNINYPSSRLEFINLIK
mgnify:CR=1 FL=1